MFLYLPRWVDAWRCATARRNGDRAFLRLVRPCRGAAAALSKVPNVFKKERGSGNERSLCKVIVFVWLSVAWLPWQNAFNVMKFSPQTRYISWIDLERFVATSLSMLTWVTACTRMWQLTCLYVYGVRWLSFRLPAMPRATWRLIFPSPAAMGYCFPVFFTLSHF